MTVYRLVVDGVESVLESTPSDPFTARLVMENRCVEALESGATIVLFELKGEATRVYDAATNRWVAVQTPELSSSGPAV